MKTILFSSLLLIASNVATAQKISPAPTTSKPKVGTSTKSEPPTQTKPASPNPSKSEASTPPKPAAPPVPKPETTNTENAFMVTLKTPS